MPSPKLFKNYIDYMGKKLGGTLTSYNFRSKKSVVGIRTIKLKTVKKANLIMAFLTHTTVLFYTVKPTAKVVTNVNLPTKIA